MGTAILLVGKAMLVLLGLAGILLVLGRWLAYRRNTTTILSDADGYIIVRLDPREILRKQQP